MMENVLSFLRAAAPWISLGLLIAFLCVRPAIRKGKAEDDYAEEGMCVGMCLGLMQCCAIRASIFTLFPM